MLDVVLVSQNFWIWRRIEFFSNLKAHFKNWKKSMWQSSWKTRKLYQIFFIDFSILTSLFRFFKFNLWIWIFWKYPRFFDLTRFHNSIDFYYFVMKIHRFLLQNQNIKKACFQMSFFSRNFSKLILSQRHTNFAFLRINQMRMASSVTEGKATIYVSNDTSTDVFYNPGKIFVWIELINK